jgi:hypothetical protein
MTQTLPVTENKMSELDASEIVAIIFGGIFLTGLFFYLIIRWATNIRRQLWNQRQQINILIKIAEKIGVEYSDEIEGIHTKNNSSNDDNL